MSRIGKKPVAIPAGVTAKVEDGATVITGKLGTLTIPTQKHITVKVEGDQIVLSRDTDLDNAKAMHGLNRALINNAVIGVSKGYSKGLEIVGVGFRADLAGNKLTLKLGFSHDINYIVPEGIKLTVTDGGIRQAARRRRRLHDPRLPQARTLQGQGCPLLGRTGHDQARQEERITGERN